MRIVMELEHVRLMLSYELHGESESTRGVHFVVIEDLVMHGAHLQDMGLQRDLESNGLFVMHGVLLNADVSAGPWHGRACVFSKDVPWSGHPMSAPSSP